MNQPAYAPFPSALQPGPLGYAEHNENYWRRNLAVSVFGSFTTLVSLSMLLPFLPLYVRQLGVVSQSAVIQWSGVAFGATFLRTAVTAPLWGHLADRYGRKPMLVRAAVGMSVVMSLIGIAHTVYQLVALRWIFGRRQPSCSQQHRSAGSSHELRGRFCAPRDGDDASAREYVDRADHHGLHRKPETRSRFSLSMRKSTKLRTRDDR